MYFWLKFFHVAAMAVWFTGLFFLPRLFVARHRAEADAERARFIPMVGTLYFGVMSPAALVTITLGMILFAFGPSGAWLAIKLTLVTLAVMLHLYFGVLLYELERGNDLHATWFYHVVGWVPLLLVLAVAGLTAAKPQTVPPLPPPPNAAQSAPGYSDAGRLPSASGGGGFSPYTPMPWRKLSVPPSQPVTMTIAAVTADSSRAHGHTAATGSGQRSHRPAVASASSITADRKWLQADTWLRTSRRDMKSPMPMSPESTPITRPPRLSQNDSSAQNGSPITR